MDQSDLPRYKTLGVNAEATVTLPAHVWIGFAASYHDADWSCWEASAINLAAQEQMLDPVYLRERQAERQHERDMHERMHGAVFGGLLGGSDDDPRKDA